MQGWLQAQEAVTTTSRVASRRPASLTYLLFQYEPSKTPQRLMHQINTTVLPPPLTQNFTSNMTPITG
jgi:hypothetical protein